MVNQTAVPIEPLFDTWGIRKYSGAWVIEPPIDFTSLSVREVNTWYIDTMMGMLAAFSELARVWKVFFSPSNESEVDGIVLRWQPENPYEDYIKIIIDAIQKYPTAVEELRMQVDLLVFVRTEESPNQPIPGWVRELGELVIRGGPEFGEPYLCFSIEHTLFRAFSYYGKDNRELFSLNQPLLENALRRLEKCFGEICEVEGLPGIYEYGFLPDEEGDLD